MNSIMIDVHKAVGDANFLEYAKSMTLNIKAYRPEKDLPLVFSKDPQGNAGWDLYATKDVEVGNGEVIKVPVNACFAIPTGYFGMVNPRSGLSSEGVNIIPGTIDSNYRGQISAIVQNISGQKIVIERGMKLAQIVFMKHEIPNFVEVEGLEDLGETLRGSSGFGSSGKF